MTDNDQHHDPGEQRPEETPDSLETKAVRAVRRLTESEQAKQVTEALDRGAESAREMAARVREDEHVQEAEARVREMATKAAASPRVKRARHGVARLLANLSRKLDPRDD